MFELLERRVAQMERELRVWRVAGIIFVFGVLVGIFMGCATSRKITKVSPGMSRDEVIKIMGKPVSTSLQGATEYLSYNLHESGNASFVEGWWGVKTSVPYYVRLIDGKVESFGRKGDFDSVQKPVIKIETDSNIKTQSDVTTTSKGDLYTELMKLKQLKEQGLLTEQEFQTKKKELLKKY